MIQLGDLSQCLRSTPWLSALASRYAPRCLHVAARPATGEIFEHHPDVQRTFRISRGVGGFFTLVRRARRGRYDLALDLTGSYASRLMTALSGASTRLGVERCQSRADGAGTSTGRERGGAMSLRQVFGRLGMDPPGTQPIFPCDRDAAVKAARLLAELGLGAQDRIVVLSPRGERGEGGAQTPWGELAVKITERWQTVPVALIPPNEGENVALMAGLLGSSFVVRPTDLATFAAVARRAAIVICDAEEIELLAATQRVPVARFPAEPARGSSRPRQPPESLIDGVLSVVEVRLRGSPPRSRGSPDSGRTTPRSADD